MWQVQKKKKRIVGKTIKNNLKMEREKKIHTHMHTNKAESSISPHQFICGFFTHRAREIEINKKSEATNKSELKNRKRKNQQRFFFYSFYHLCTRIQFQLTLLHSRLPAALSDNECISHINSMNVDAMCIATCEEWNASEQQMFSGNAS